MRRPERLRVLRGDYRDRDTHHASGIRLDDVGYVLNYPDGNHAELEQFVIWFGRLGKFM